jgi:polyphosphate glucokinase
MDRKAGVDQHRAKPSQRSFDAALMSSVNEMAGRDQQAKRVLVIDVGGTSVKILLTGQSEGRSFRSGTKLIPRLMVSELTSSPLIGPMTQARSAIPAQCWAARPAAEPVNLGRGWVGFDFERLPAPQPMILAKEEPHDDHHHYRL